MPKIAPYLFLMLIASFASGACAVERVFISQEQRTPLIELYTSEGCSSCPPAERWLSGLKNNAYLWKRFVPVAFHVDYWDYLGWRDRFSDARFSERQSDYQRHGYLSMVYTPGMMRNGREWRDWSDATLPTPARQSIGGGLKAIVDNDHATVDFTPPRMLKTPLTLNMALLGFNLSTRVAAGENGGKVLTHDFTVMAFHQYRLAPNNGAYHWELSYLPIDRAPITAAMALWINAADDPTPIQATGGWLN